MLAGVRRSSFEARVPSLSRLARNVPVFIAGEGAYALPELPEGTTALPRDLVEAAGIVDRVPGAQSPPEAVRAVAVADRPAGR